MELETIEQLKKELDEQTRLAEERLNQLKYLQADFDNYRKWQAKEKDGIIALANERLIHDLLVILDEFELALPAIENEKNKEGVQMHRSNVSGKNSIRIFMKHSAGSGAGRRPTRSLKTWGKATG